MSLELQDELTRELRENPQHRGRVIVHACPKFWAMWTATLVHHDGNLEPLGGSYTSITRTRAEAHVRWREASVSAEPGR